MDCLFCKIAAGEIPSTVVYEDEHIFCFRDINPQAPVHVLIIPRVHIPSMDGVNAENVSVIAHIFAKIPEIAASLELANGYRVISNCGADAAQTVKHLHFHLVGGTKMAEKMV